MYPSNQQTATSKRTAFKHSKVHQWLLLAAGLLFLNSAGAGHLPLWELGGGIGFLDTPHYRGSTQSEQYFVPFPYMVYRGEKLKADREGIRTELWETEDFTLDMSFAANVPVAGDASETRQGMPDLDLVLEAGVSADFGIWHQHSQDLEQKFLLKLPLRAVVSIGDPVMTYRGFVFSPYIQLQNKLSYANAIWRYYISIGPIYATENYHDYFYEVENKYATAQRPAYDAKGGYSGSRITLSFTRNTDKIYLGVFARYDHLGSAVFEDSPLVQTNDYFVLGVVASWIFTRSSERAANHGSTD
ncbi:MAG: MipA/OmpV family protein [Gammaproteobacteria bacterium]|nr:MipA/OmpV family protein [Gammaproteobacteria bacterium]MDH5802847.1 MipA/OmpV family protein [Gammaproteobacteria bacterium]